MPRQFNGTSDHIQTTIGAFGSATSFGCMAIIWKSNAQNRMHGLMGTYTSGGAVRWALEIDGSNVLAGGNDSGPSMTTSMTITTADGWVIIVYGKGTGTVAPRYHKCVLSTGVWTHENGGSTLANGTTPSSTGVWRFGRWQSSDFASGQMALAAAWTGRNLTDAEAELLSGGLHAWLSLRPDALWQFDSSTVTSLSDMTGGGANQNAISGTTAILDGVPGWTYGHPPITPKAYSAPAATPFQGWGVPI